MRKPIDLDFKIEMFGVISPNLSGAYGMHGILDEIYDLLRIEILISITDDQKKDIKNY